MTCEEFRSLDHGDQMSAEALSHLRGCADCLEHATADDPMNLFRAIGGEGHVPPGGVDAFVGEVMHEVKLRATERNVGSTRRRVVVPWSIAAALFLVFATSLVVYRPEPASAPTPGAVRSIAAVAPASVQPVVPVVDHWGADNATIVEVPTKPSDDIRVVMVFDNKLPVDL